MFDTITGLPVHALVVHAVVVGLPLAAALTLLAAARPRWHSWLPAAVVADALIVVFCLVARRSGQLLQARVQQFGGRSIAASHGREGSWLWAFAVALLATALLAWWTARQARWTGIALVLVALAAVSAVGWTVVVGDSGARAVWEQTVAHTTAP
jgi:hypothetical protein